MCVYELITSSHYQNYAILVKQMEDLKYFFSIFSFYSIEIFSLEVLN